MSSSSSTSTTTSDSTSSSASDSDTNLQQRQPLPLSDLRRKINRSHSRTNQERFYPHEVMTIHAELSSDTEPRLPLALPKKTKTNDTLYTGKFWNNSHLVPGIKTRHSISKFINAKNKKIALLEYNLQKKDKLIQVNSKKRKKLKHKNKKLQQKILKLCDISAASSSSSD